MKLRRRNLFGGMYKSPNKKRKLGLPAPRFIKAKGKGETDYWSIWPHKSAVSANHGGHSGNGPQGARMRKHHARARQPAGMPQGVHLTSKNPKNIGQICYCGGCGSKGVEIR